MIRYFHAFTFLVLNDCWEELNSQHQCRSHIKLLIKYCFSPIFSDFYDYSTVRKLSSNLTFTWRFQFLPLTSLLIYLLMSGTWNENWRLSWNIKTVQCFYVYYSKKNKVYNIFQEIRMQTKKNKLKLQSTESLIFSFRIHLNSSRYRPTYINDENVSLNLTLYYLSLPKNVFSYIKAFLSKLT